MSVTQRKEAGFGWNANLLDKAPVEWPRSEGGNATERSVLERLLWRPFRGQWRRERGKQGDEGLGKENGGLERLNKQLARSKLQAVHDSMTAAREGRSCCVWARLCQAETWAPFTRVRTNLCTDKNLHGSTLRLHGTGGTGRIHPFDRHCSIFRTDSCKHVNRATFCSDCAFMAGNQCRDRSKLARIRVNTTVTEFARIHVNGRSRNKICPDWCKQELRLHSHTLTFFNQR